MLEVDSLSYLVSRIWYLVSRFWSRSLFLVDVVVGIVVIVDVANGKRSQ